jgi:hypothetical protein
LSGNRTGATVFLANSTSSLASAADPAIIDKFGYGTSPDNSPEGEAAQFLPEISFNPEWSFFRTADTDNNAADFIIQPTSPRHASSLLCEAGGPPKEESPSSTPDNQDGQQPYLTRSPEVKIFRFLPNPAGEDPGNEWVELKNNGSQAVLLDNWLLDDRNTGEGPAADALALSGLINPAETRRFLLPTSTFALNNSNGDEVNLYFSDKTLADKAVYAVSAPDDGIFELTGGVWQPPAPQPASSGSGGSLADNLPLAQADVRITEFMPNPFGPDEGKEWVELYNAGNATVTLSGWKLDDGSSAGSPGSSAYELDGSLKIFPFGYLVVNVPQGKFALNNSGSDAVRLFRPGNSLAQTVSFAEAPEGQSFGADKKGAWSFGWPSPGFDSLADLPLPNVVISELLPSPAGEDEEFVEIFNASSTAADLEGFILRIGEREKVLGRSSLASSTHLALYEDELPVKLRNSGQTVVLSDNFGRELSRVVYSKALPGQAYAFISPGEYAWTAKPTPGEANELVLGAAVSSETRQKAENRAVAPSEAKASADLKKLVKETQELNRQLAEKVAALENLTLALADSGQKPEQAKPVTAEPKEAGLAARPGQGVYLLIAGLAALSLLLLVRQYFSKKSQR